MELQAAKANPGTDKAESGNTALAALKFHFSSGASSKELGSRAEGAAQGISPSGEEEAEEDVKAEEEPPAPEGE